MTKYGAATRGSARPPGSGAEPVRRLRQEPPALDVVAIDNLPSLLPPESSAAFSADLTPYLRRLPDDPVWTRCRARFEEAVARGVSNGMVM